MRAFPAERPRLPGAAGGVTGLALAFLLADPSFSSGPAPCVDYSEEMRWIGGLALPGNRQARAIAYENGHAYLPSRSPNGTASQRLVLLRE